MLHTLKATLSPSGQLIFDEEVRITRPIAVLVTLLDDLQASNQATPEPDPLAWSLNDEERRIWEELPTFRALHPVTLDTLDIKP
ncbi:hypothetical protein [uncultured Thiocystis sp.]|jgi:hypothetical protein|uniref:hypothetical protein n=1 Tax=uncultured Thiocystis sp. TaxID=1202134 RepID=UPI0025EA38AF|nr:hypothetical protein [uncultured Thiocystis sp.]